MICPSFKNLAPKYMPNNIDISRKGATWLIGASLIAKSTRYVSDRSKNSDSESFFPALGIFRQEGCTTAVGSPGKHNRAKEVAGIFHQDRRKQKRFDRVTIDQGVAAIIQPVAIPQNNRRDGSGCGEMRRSHPRKAESPR